MRKEMQPPEWWRPVVEHPRMRTDDSEMILQTMKNENDDSNVSLRLIFQIEMKAQTKIRARHDAVPRETNLSDVRVSLPMHTYQYQTEQRDVPVCCDHCYCV